MKWVKWPGGYLLPVLNRNTNWYNLGWSFKLKLQTPIAGKWWTREQLSCAELPVHNTVLLWLGGSVPTFRRRKERRRMIKTTNCRRVTGFSATHFLFMRACEGFFSHQRTELPILFLWKGAWQQRVGFVQPALPPFLSLLVYRPNQEYTVFLTAHGTQPRKPNQVPFQLTVYFPHPWQSDLQEQFSQRTQATFIWEIRKIFFSCPTQRCTVTEYFC